MKRINIFILIIITISFFTCNIQVKAKDTLYSMNSYSEENFKLLEKSYNKENKQDGFIVAGEYLKEDTDDKEQEPTNENYQTIFIKYNYEGKKIWEYSYGMGNKDAVESLTYAYDDQGNIDGYIFVLKETTKNTTTENNFLGQFIKLDLNGKLVMQKEIPIENFYSLNKIIPIINESRELTGYIAIASFIPDKDIHSTIIKFDKNLDIVWKNDQAPSADNDVIYEDIVNIYEDAKVVGYAVIEKSGPKKQYTNKLLKFNLDGQKELITDSLDKYHTITLAESNNGFIIYGLTQEVKVEGGNYSYYLINYDPAGSEQQESIGDFPISDKEKLKLLPLKKDDKITEFLLFYRNANDSSKEVIKLDSDGLFQRKIKKINNEYYTINDIETNNDTLYFIGYITCPEEDNCDYNTHSLFLISDEDKVIEVKDNTVKDLSLYLILPIAILCILFIIKKKLH